MMKIVVGYDGSPEAKAALQFAKTHAKGFGAKVHILTCMETGPDKHLKEVENAEKDLEKVRHSLAADNIPSETHLHLMISGLTPGKDLVQFGQKIDAHEIIVGVRKTSRLNKFIFGSTAQYVILHGHCPVVTVK